MTHEPLPSSELDFTSLQDAARKRIEVVFESATEAREALGALSSNKALAAAGDDVQAKLDAIDKAISVILSHA